MIRKLRTQRDNQQWMLDLALNMRGRVQNFERVEMPFGGDRLPDPTSSRIRGAVTPLLGEEGWRVAPGWWEDFRP